MQARRPRSCCRMAAATPSLKRRGAHRLWRRQRRVLGLCRRGRGLALSFVAGVCAVASMAVAWRGRRQRLRLRAACGERAACGGVPCAPTSPATRRDGRRGGMCFAVLGSARLSAVSQPGAPQQNAPASSAHRTPAAHCRDTASMANLHGRLPAWWSGRMRCMCAPTCVLPKKLNPDLAAPRTTGQQDLRVPQQAEVAHKRRLKQDGVADRLQAPAG
eukprot:366399-Chlamydomonas_euryale.AAC.15